MDGANSELSFPFLSFPPSSQESCKTYIWTIYVSHTQVTRKASVINFISRLFDDIHTWSDYHSTKGPLKESKRKAWTGYGCGTLDVFLQYH